MKRISTALLAAGLMALGACGGGDDSAANNVAADTYNVAPDDLGNDVLLGNELDTNLGTGNEVDANLGAGNEADADASTNAQ
jgi:predicted lipoprotein